MSPYRLSAKGRNNFSGFGSALSSMSAAMLGMSVHC
jgi:hypothetical protein